MPMMLNRSRTNIPAKSNFRDYLGGDVLILQLMGLQSMGNIFKGNQPKSNYWEICPFIVGLGTMMFGVVFDLRNVYDLSKTDIMSSIEVGGEVLSTMLTIFKGFRLWVYRRELCELLKIHHHLWDVQMSRKSVTKNMLADAESARMFRIYYGTAVTIAVGSFAIRPYMVYLQFHLFNSNGSFDYSDTVFPAHYFFKLDTFERFLLCTTYENIGLYFLNLYWISADTLFPQLITHLSIQFKILSNDIRGLDEMNPVASTESVNVGSRLKTIIQEHSELFTYAKSVQEFYNPIIFTTVLSNSVNLCSCLYSLEYRLNESNWGDVEKNLSHAIVLLGQTFLYCTYAQRLNDEINEIHNSVYECPWTDFSMSTKVIILIVMLRTQKEYVYSVYGLLRLNMPQLTTIITATMRYFALLRSVA